MNVLDEILNVIADDMMGKYDMSDVQTETQAVFPLLKVYHKMTFTGTAPKDTKAGQFFSLNTGMPPADELTMVIYQTRNQRICGSKTVKSGGPVYCRCLNQEDGAGFPFVASPDGRQVMGETPRDCNLCPHNAFHAQGKGVTLLPVLSSDGKCKSTKVWGGFLIHDPENITLSTVTPVLLSCGAGALSNLYRKDMQSWYSVADALKMAKPHPLPWHSVVFKVMTREFNFDAGSTYLPIFEILSGGARVFTPMKEIAATVGTQLMLGAGAAMDVKALAEMVSEGEYAPVMTGKPQD